MLTGESISLCFQDGCLITCSGLGFGICERLLLQLSQSVPSDSLPQAFSASLDSGTTSSNEQPTPNALTLILACRSRERALEARSNLLVGLQAENLRRRLLSPGLDDEYSRKFLESLVIDFVPLDLGIVDGVFAFCDTVNKTYVQWLYVGLKLILFLMLHRYPYISHIFCNAGTGSFGGVDWFGAFVQLCSHPLDAFTNPTFKIQYSGVMSKDNFGWVWQCNVFGHYLMVRNVPNSLECLHEMFSFNAICLGSHSREVP